MPKAHQKPRRRRIIPRIKHGNGFWRVLIGKLALAPCRNSQPSQYDLVACLFLRGLGLIYLFAFASFGVQAMGLIGSHGILPLSEYLAVVHNRFGAESYWLMPNLFWF